MKAAGVFARSGKGGVPQPPTSNRFATQSSDHHHRRQEHSVALGLRGGDMGTRGWGSQRFGVGAVPGGQMDDPSWWGPACPSFPIWPSSHVPVRMNAPDLNWGSPWHAALPGNSVSGGGGVWHAHFSHLPWNVLIFLFFCVASSFQDPNVHLSSKQSFWMLLLAQFCNFSTITRQPVQNPHL